MSRPSDPTRPLHAASTSQSSKTPSKTTSSTPASKPQAQTKTNTNTPSNTSSDALPNPDANPTTHVPPSDPPTSPEQPAQPSKKRKRNDTRLQKPHICHSMTFRSPRWAYIHLELVTPGMAAALPGRSASEAVKRGDGGKQEEADAAMPDTTIPPLPLPPPPPAATPSTAPPSLTPLTTLTLLTPPLTSHLGLLGSTIPLDILHTRGRHVWLRIPRQDARAVQAALAGWMGWCGEDLVPGENGGDGNGGSGNGNGNGNGGGRVRYAWRVRGVGVTIVSVGVGEGEADGGDLFVS